MNFRLLLLFNLILLMPLIAAAQRKDQTLNISVGYNILDIRRNLINGDGIRGSIGFQKNWFEISATSFYNPVFYYDTENSAVSRKMNDKFVRLGIETDFRVISFDRHEFFIGLQFQNFFMTSHYYYFENKISNIIIEYDCKDDECPHLLGPWYNFDFGTKYNWQLGIHLNCRVNLFSNLFLTTQIDWNYLNVTRRLESTGSYYEGGLFSFSPSINLTYKLPFGKENRTKDNTD